MSGLDKIPIRWPDQYDPAFFDQIFREVLAKADVRNSLEGLGISITGTSDEFATISASADLQALLDASLLTITDESANLDNVRQLVPGGPGITLTDNGAGTTVEIDLGLVPWQKLSPIPDLSVIGVATADDGFDMALPIQSTDNDTLLRRTSDTLNFGTITPGMLADVDTDALAEGATNLYFTDERAQDAVGGILTDSSSIDFTYDDATPSITAAVSSNVPLLDAQNVWTANFNSFNGNGFIRGDVTGYLVLQSGVNGVIVRNNGNNTDLLTVFQDGSEIDLSATTLDFNASTLDFGGDVIRVNGNGFIRGDVTGYLVLQSGVNGVIIRNFGNNTDLLTVFQDGSEIDLSATTLDFNGKIDNNQPVALGGGSTATLGTIGGSGPTTAGQAQWLEIAINGTTHWIPVWT